MFLECTCADISVREWNKLMKGAKRTNYRNLVRKIKLELPELYESLALNYNNPYSNQTRETETHYILVHSGIEYFIRK